MSSLRIESIECIPVTVPIEAPILTCYGSLGSYPRVIIKIVAENGLVGYGETSARYKADTFRMFENIFKGASPWESTRLINRIKHWNYYPWQKPEPLMAGLEIACLDLVGKATGEPLHRILGGKIHNEVPVASYLFYRHANAEGYGKIHSVEEVVDFAKAQVADYGFSALKLKGGYFPPETDRDTLYALRDTFGRDMRLRLDPQGCWTPVTAIRIGRQLDAIDLEYYEDPCWNAAAMAQVRKSVTTPLATNMCVTQFEEFHPATQLGAVDVVLSDIWYWGGVRATMAADRMCHATGIDLGMHSSAELGVAWAAMIHVASAMPHMKLAIDCMNLHLADDIIVGGKIVPRNGVVTPPDGPGLGIEIDEDKLAKYGALATSGAANDRYLNPNLADSARPGWSPHSPAW
ncbi:mandelate racemase/muconate lactonizing enzyme family protein [Chelatococcus asaccharovorans]|uniref:mandelate racemase/muconate lactonizing enzyme family protein n=1 Tax=Chelatococcus asaccharovorans TaxID=28210 RepID=UPI00224C638A|nr:enolase C-terminal domain-like protein [Chelatococcus asaccharovorans]CAH1651074.1 Glucarate dehydratase [Chelatococcus asaccharovorans]CAH1692716.1 Glucarate dehydratase [Chelatococcus asaccharovorans]